MSNLSPIDEYEQQLPRPALRLDYPETLSQHLADCPYGCDDGGWLEDVFKGVSYECGYCNG